MYLTRCNTNPVQKDHANIDGFLDAFFNVKSTWDLNQNTRTRQNDDAYSVEIDLPGVSKETLAIRVDNDLIHIKATRSGLGSAKDHKGPEVNKSFYLPDDVDVDKINAVIQHGVLTLNLPKREEAKPKSIEIKVN
ncbi:MAG: Hsp20/alpha crystallin family protein [Verrucomicrobiota bacterium]